MKKAGDLPKTAEEIERERELCRGNYAAQMESMGYDASGNPLPEKKAGEKAKKTKKTERIVMFADSAEEAPVEYPKGKETVNTSEKNDIPDAGAKKKRIAAKTGKTGRAKAIKPNEKITPASIFKKMIAFGKAYQIDGEQDFLEAARIYAEEAGLIDQMRDRLAEDGLTVLKTYKTGDVEVAHPLLSELPRHVESANKCLTTIGGMITERGARVEKAKRDLDAFRLH